MNLYPLRFHPIHKPKIWGAESWLLSGYPDSLSVVSNGQLAGNELNDLIEVYMSDLVGDAVYELFGNNFPLLFKIIDAQHDLSIQVHPDDDTAFERHGSMGKMEMWYAMKAQQGANLISGFKRECDKETYQHALDTNRLTDLLQQVEVQQGDVLFIHPGLVHSIGSGIVLAEIQQASDITYRIFDYNRTDANGQMRELHTAQALDVIDYSAHHTPKITYCAKQDGAVNLVKCPYFTTNLLSFDRTIIRDYTALDSFVVYLCVEGTMQLVVDGVSYNLSQGETILLPAVLNEVNLQPQTQNVRLLEIYMDSLDEI